MSFHVRKRICILEISFLFDYIERSTDHFFMDIGDIDTDETQRHEYDSHHDGVDDDHDTNIGKSERCDTNLIDKLEKERYTPRDYDKKSHISDQLEWE